MGFDVLTRLFAQMLPQRSHGGEPLVVFLHIPKTGGTSMRRYLRQTFGDRLMLTGKVPKQKGDTAVAAVKDLAADPTLAGDMAAVGGHAGYGSFDLGKNGRDVIYVSVMRDPVSRALSTYNYQRTTERHVKNERMRDRTLLEAIHETNYLTRITDQQIRFLFGQSLEPQRVLSRERFLIGKLEHLNVFLEEARDLIPNKPERFKRMNSRGPNYKDELRAQPGYEEALALITEAVKRDREFYDSFGEILVSAPLAKWRRNRPAKAA